MRVPAFAWLLLFGCGSWEPDFVTTQGVSVHDNYGLSLAQRAEIDQVLLAVQNQGAAMGMPVKRMQDFLTGSILFVESGSYDIGIEVMGHFDLYYHQLGFGVLNDDCAVGDSALPHELLHGYLWMRDGNPDDAHKAREWLEVQPQLDQAARAVCSH